MICIKHFRYWRDILILLISTTTRRNGMRITGKWRNGAPFQVCHLTSDIAALLLLEGWSPFELSFSLHIYKPVLRRMIDGSRWPCLQTRHRTRAQTILGMNWLRLESKIYLKPRLLIQQIFFGAALGYVRRTHLPSCLSCNSESL